MKQTFATSKLKNLLEHSFGWKLRSFQRIDGSAALNFKAVRALDGLTFLVKCSPLARQGMYDRLVEHLEALKGTKAVQRLFARKCPVRFCEYNLVCLSWCEGINMLPDALTDGQLDSFLDDYLAFSADLQKVRRAWESFQLLKWRGEMIEKCKRSGRVKLRRVLERMHEGACAYRQEAMRVIHCDFHHGNFRFINGRLSGVYDLEELRLGYPAEDIVRYFTCASEHLRWYEWRRKRRMLLKFQHAVRRLPYSRHEWEVAINSRFLVKAFIRTRKVARIGAGMGLNLVWCAMFYDKLRDAVDSVKTSLPTYP